MAKQIYSWEELVKQNFSLADIRKNDQAYLVMEKEASNGHILAQHNMGLWNELISNDYTEALKWYQKASIQGNETSKLAYNDLKDRIDKSNKGSKYDNAN